MYGGLMTGYGQHSLWNLDTKVVRLIAASCCTTTTAPTTTTPRSTLSGPR